MIASLQVVLFKLKLARHQLESLDVWVGCEDPAAGSCDCFSIWNA